jgi:polyisoprenoid-binding protein YceI
MKRVFANPTAGDAMKLKIFAVAALCALASHAWAQATRDPAKVEAGTYAVEPAHTQVLFSVTHLGFSTYYGQFSGASGVLKLDPKKPESSSLEVHIPVASVTTASQKLTGELKSADWLNADAHPEIIFKTTQVLPSGQGEAKVTGELTLNGVTKSIPLTVKFNGAGGNPMSKKYTVGFEVSGKLQRSEFGVKKYVPFVSDEVNIIISAAFEKQG